MWGNKDIYKKKMNIVSILPYYKEHNLKVTEYCLKGGYILRLKVNYIVLNVEKRHYSHLQERYVGNVKVSNFILQ